MSMDFENRQPGPADRELDSVFAAYREACPDREPGPNFMPVLWQRIEAHRSLPHLLGRWAQACMTAAAAICLLLSLWISSPGPVFQQGAYIDMLDDADTPETMIYSEVSLVENQGGGNQR